MMRELRMLLAQAERNEMRQFETEHCLRLNEIRQEKIFDFMSLMYEATELDYQDRLELIGLDDIKKYTLAEVESCRFMTDRQFNNLRASKRE